MELLIDVVLNIGSDEFYRAERYNIPLSVALINSGSNGIFDIIEESTRQTDTIQQLNSDLIVVFLPHTNYKDAVLFMDKLKEKVDFTYHLCEFKEARAAFTKKLFLDNAKEKDL